MDFGVYMRRAYISNPTHCVSHARHSPFLLSIETLTRAIDTHFIEIGNDWCQTDPECEISIQSLNAL